MMSAYNISSWIVAFVCLLQFTTFANDLPSNWKRCKISDTTCLRSAVEDAVHDLANGNMDLDIPPMEPFHLDSLDIAPNGIVTVGQHYKNLNIYGLGESTVESVSINYDTRTLKAKSFSPVIRLEADYKMNGRLMLINVRGKGPCNVTLVDTEIKHVLKGDFIEQNGNQFFKVKKYKVNIKPKGVKYNFKKLENGKALNSILNKQWDTFFNAVKGDYEKAFSGILISLANKVFTQVPMNKILLD